MLADDCSAAVVAFVVLKRHDRLTMYLIDKDTVVELKDIPKHDPGASEPVVFADDGRVVLAYFLAPPDAGQIAYVEFLHCRAHLFGSPNDETLHGHPLYERGLKPYSIAEVKNSSWIRALERINSVHPRHDPKRFQLLRHFVLAFHDSMFECVAEGFKASTDNGEYKTTSEGLLEFLNRTCRKA